MGLLGWLKGELSFAYHRWNILRAIRKRGWTALYVDGEGTPFCYTIGLGRAVGCPEIFMSGLGHFYSNVVLGAAYRQLQSGELVLADGIDWSADADVWPRLTWKAVHPSQIRADHLAALLCIRDYWGEPRDDLRVFQLVFPDEAGVMPWEEGYDWGRDPGQNMLWLPYAEPSDKRPRPLERRAGRKRPSRRARSPGQARG